MPLPPAKQSVIDAYIVESQRLRVLKRAAQDDHAAVIDDLRAEMIAARDAVLGSVPPGTYAGSNLDFTITVQSQRVEKTKLD
jgi:hypothetical protein